MELRCKDCQELFTLTDAEITWYTQKRLHLPIRCPPCRLKKRLRNAAKITGEACLLLACLLTLACGGGTTTVSTTSDAGILEDTWRGNITIRRTGMATTTAPTVWTFTRDETKWRPGDETNTP
jgi:hypothetical protein